MFAAPELDERIVEDLSEGEDVGVSHANNGEFGFGETRPRTHVEIVEQLLLLWNRPREVLLWKVALRFNKQLRSMWKLIPCPSIKVAPTSCRCPSSPLLEKERDFRRMARIS